MPTYKVTDPNTGRTVELTGDAPPTEQELNEIFAQLDQPQAEPARKPFRGGRTGRAQELAQERRDQREEFLASLPPERRALLESISAPEAAAIGLGAGLTKVGRGVGSMLGISEPVPQDELQAIEQLGRVQPVTKVAQIAGEAAPFLVPGAAVGAGAKLLGKTIGTGARALGTTALGAAEGAAIASGEGRELGEVLFAAGIGGSVAGALELGVPVFGRLGGKLVRKMTGKAPTGAVVDSAGNPTQELQDALDAEGITFDDLAAEAVEVLREQGAGAVPDQAARAARFAEAGIPATRGDITQQLADQATEARLFESASDPMAEQFRQFRLKQSDAIRRSLEEGVDLSKMPEDTGGMIKDALTGRKELMRAQKNELYRDAAKAANKVGGIPLFTDGIRESIGDERKIRRINRITGGKVDDVLDTLAEFGVIERKGIADIDPLSVENFEDLRSAIKGIERADTTGGLKVITGDIVRALDEELDNFSEFAGAKGLSSDVVAALRESRKATRQLKEEFNPKALVGKLTETKRNSAENMIEASKVYSQLASKSQPVESVRKLVASLRQAGEGGENAISGLKSTIMLDLIDAGFGTTSRKIDGVPTFNPGAFKRRLDTIGKDKIEAVFKGDSESLKRLRNIRQIAKDITPQGAAVPKGSASVILDLMNKLGVIGITSKVPGGSLLVEAIQGLGEKSRTRKEVQRALTPQVERMAETLTDIYPQIGKILESPKFTQTAALGTAAALAQPATAQDEQ